MSNEAMRVALEALKTCETGGYVDIDGDFRKTYHFDQALISSAISLLSAAVEEGEGEPRTLSRIDAQWWMDNRANVIAALSAKGLQIVSNAEHVWIAPQKGSA